MATQQIDHPLKQNPNGDDYIAPTKTAANNTSTTNKRDILHSQASTQATITTSTSILNPDPNSVTASDAFKFVVGLLSVDYLAHAAALSIKGGAEQGKEFLTNPKDFFLNPFHESIPNFSRLTFEVCLLAIVLFLAFCKRDSIKKGWLSFWDSNTNNSEHSTTPIPIPLTKGDGTQGKPTRSARATNLARIIIHKNDDDGYFDPTANYGNHKWNN